MIIFKRLISLWKSVSNRKKKFLLVEDDEFMKSVIARVLHSIDYELELTWVKSVEDAKHALLKSDFDLVITDFMMPKLNGIKFVEHLHSLQPRIPIIFITGFLSVISGKTILDDVAEVLAKPFGPDVLRSTVHRLLDSTSYSAP